ncbi:MAG: 5-(carboxyamino)imidazole ribonucleotide mutase [Thaumarchaeota archaeon]|nr:5-(carboxyamino)imidazole ribonucleotide mutase [Nitrososphaerota archaeon]
MGSSSDGRVMAAAAEALDGFGVAHEDQIVSAHRTPSRLAEYARHAEEAGVRVIIAGAGGAAHLPGMIASNTLIPVIGVPIAAGASGARAAAPPRLAALGGLDALLSISEMPTGSPVACVGINKAANAALYALKILAVESPALRKRLASHRLAQHRAVVRESERMRRSGVRAHSRLRKAR